MRSNQAKQESTGEKVASILALLMITLLPLSACAQMKTVKWKEEVKLTNGQVIIVERSQEYRSVYSGGPLKPGWLFNYERIRTVLPSSNVAITWEGRLKPLALDTASNGSFYLVAVVAEAAGEREYKLKPGEYHVSFTYIGNDKWQRIPITAVPGEIHPNMLAGTYGLFIKQESKTDFVDLALKKKVDSDPTIDSIYRKWPTGRGDQKIKK